MSTYPVLSGSRCRLQVLGPDDAVAWHAGEDAEQLKWFDLTPASLEDVRHAITHWRHNWDDGGPKFNWGVFLGEQLVGGVELQQREGRWMNVSYVIFPPFRRRGLAVDALRPALEWGFATLDVDEAGGVAHVDNLASHAVLRRAGFTDNGVADRSLWGDEPGPMRHFVLPRPGTTARTDRGRSGSERGEAS